MLFVNFLDKADFGGQDGYFRVASNIGTFLERQKEGKPEFVEADATYFDNEKTLIFTEAEDAGWGSNELMNNLFRCNEKKAKEVNGIERNKEEDMVILTDKVRFVEGVKTYFRVIPLGDAMLICLFGGAAEFFVYDEWIPMNRSGKGINVNAKRIEMSTSRLMDFLRMEDKETGYVMSKDGSICCELLISSGKNGTSVKSRVLGDEFLLLRDDRLKKAQEKARKDKERRELEAMRKKQEAAEFEARRREQELLKAEEEKAKKPRRTSTGSKKASSNSVSSSEAAETFMDLLKSMGYEG